jgi:UDP-N-acetylmuramyl pentapeptide phosphotransferase/UDP-N-acetylglucosamine-1-phosphate transferase
MHLPPTRVGEPVRDFVLTLVVTAAVTYMLTPLVRSFAVRRGLNGLMKVAGQVAVGAALVATGTQLTSVPMPGGGTFVLTTSQGTVLTILVVVATINAVSCIGGFAGGRADYRLPGGQDAAMGSRRHQGHCRDWDARGPGGA